MAVYKRNYKRYDGAITPERLRFTILPRYSFQTAFESRFFQTFFVACFVPAVVALAIIYIRANASLLRSAGIDLNVRNVLAVDTTFFYTLFRAQTFMTFILGMFVGPGLVSPDLVNGALPLYLSRPFSRVEYVLGKFCVFATLASLITWIPGEIIFLVAVQPRRGVDGGAYANRRSDICRIVDLDFAGRSAISRHFGMGKAQTAGGRIDVRRIFRCRCVR